jgi:hypothetical protein
MRRLHEDAARGRPPGIVIRSADDISAALAVSIEQGGLMLDEQDLAPEFFDLKTGLAGQVLQKFVNYRTRLAIIVRDPSAYGGRFSELAYEHRTHAQVRFYNAEQPARTWLAQMPSGKC